MTEPTEPIRENATRPAAEQARNPMMHRWLPIGMAGVVVGVVGLAVLLFVTSANDADKITDLHGQLRTLAGQQAQAADAGQRLAAQVRGLGATPVVQPPVPVTAVAGQPGKQGQPGPGPSQAQIDGAVAAYFADHPPGATPAMVAVQVAAYLTAHPPKPGPAPTSQQIATAASDYIAAHASDFQGQAGANGTNGQDGQNATDAQVSAAVTAYCDAHSGCQGPIGAQGPPPAAWTWTDPASGQAMTCTRNTDSPDSAPTYACSANQAAPPTTTDPPPGGLLNLGGN